MIGVKSLLVMAAIALTALASAAPAQDARREVVHFASGTSSTVLKDKITGYESVEYVLGAAAGQTMAVSMQSDNASAYFNVIPPASDEAMFVGSTSGDTFSATLHANGDYVIQVYLMRNAARRNEVAQFSLSVEISGKPAKPGDLQPDFADGLMGGPDFWDVTGVGADDTLNLRKSPSAKAPILAKFPDGTMLRNKGCRIDDNIRWCLVELPDDPSVQGWVAGRYLRESAGPAAATDAKTENGFHAEGTVPCSIGADSFDHSCNFGVLRAPSGATIILNRPDNGEVRALTFTKSDQSFVAHDGAGLAWQRKDDNWWISANGNEFYLIPDAVIFGG